MTILGIAKRTRVEALMLARPRNGSADRGCCERLRVRNGPILVGARLLSLLVTSLFGPALVPAQSDNWCLRAERPDAETVHRNGL